MLDGIGRPDRLRRRSGDEVAALCAPQALLARWGKARDALPTALRAVPAGEKMPWFGPPMSPASMATARFMETWAHALDVYDALGIAPEQTDRIRHVAHLGVRTRDFALLGARAAGADRGVPRRPGRAVRRAVEAGARRTPPRR